MRYYPYPFRDSTDSRRPRAAGKQHCEADAWVDRVICLFVGLLCLATLLAISA